MDPAHAEPAQPTSPSMEEGSLAQATERYASMFTHHPHAAYSVDPEGHFTDANQRAVEMTGLSLEELRRTHFAEVIHPDDLSLMQDGFERALAGDPQLLDARVVRVDGEVVDIRCTAIPVVVGGRVVGVHGITEDVTEAKRLVRELEEANAAKLRFLGTVSHEVRTPLAALVGAVDLLMHSELTPETRHYAQVVQRSSERLGRLAGDILEFSGLEAHQTVLRRTPFDVRAVVQEVADWAVPLGENGGLDVSFTVEESVPDKGIGDARRIGQVLANLVRNAISFTAHGTVAARVRASEGTPGPDDPGRTGWWIEVEVTDTGVGIEPEQLGFLFEPFKLVDPCPARARQGVGLGLAISRDLVDLMGGRLHARSTPGEGSTFTFGFPLGTTDPA
jgi:PAS domain S-box-containing protein